MTHATDQTLTLLFLWAIAVLPQYVPESWLRRLSR